jgi:hypothetical protein
MNRCYSDSNLKMVQEEKSGEAVYAICPVRKSGIIDGNILEVQSLTGKLLKPVRDLSLKGKWI